jgi:probable phosphoglycerate mutase
MSAPADAAPPLQLFLIRHGETAWSLSGQHTGRTDIPLTAHGEQQAQELEPWLRQVRFAHVLTSPRQRARQTCDLAGLGATAEVEPDLSEWDYGDYEGRRTDDIRKEHPGWSVFTDGCPNGETPGQIADRADRLIARLQSLAGNIALFSHGQFGAVFAARWIGLAAVEGQHFAFSPAALGILAFNPARPELRVIKLWNAEPPARAGLFT